MTTMSGKIEQADPLSLTHVLGHNASGVWGRQAVKRRPTGRLAIIGDSRGQNHIGASAAESARGPYVLAKWMLSGRLSFNVGTDCVAIGGTQLVDNNGQGMSALNQYLTYIRPRKDEFDFVAVFAHGNDITAGGKTAAQIKADYLTVIAAIEEDGLRLNLNTDVPLTSSLGYYTAVQHQINLEVNAWLRETASRDGDLILIDAYLAFVDWTGTNAMLGGVGASPWPYTMDGVHYSPLGALIYARLIVKALDPLLPREKLICMMSPVDAYDNILAPRGSLLGTIGKMSGTGRALKDPANTAGSAATGTVATGWRLFKGATDAITVVGDSSATRTIYIDGEPIVVPCQKVTVTAGGSGQQGATLLTTTELSAGFVAGDKIQIAAYIDVVKLGGVINFGPIIQPRTGGGLQGVIQAIGGYQSYPLPSGPIARQVISPILVIPAGTTSIKTYFSCGVDGATADVEFYVSLVAVRRVY
jgi:lysophospholipase L1-like esterase